MQSIIRVIDLETGPHPVDGEPGIVEYGHIDVCANQQDMLGSPFNWQVGEHSFHTFQSFVKPHGPIPPETSAIHNIVDEDVEKAPAWSEIAPYVTFVNNPNKTIVALAAHNIECERPLIGAAAGDLPWIDTYKVGLRLWPESPSHSNNAIRYFLNPDGLNRSLALPTHRALSDAYVTAFTLREALNAGHSFETLIKWTNEPALLPRCKIGNWRNNGKGTPWEEVDSGFLHWILQKDFDADTKHTVRYHLNKREMDQREERELQDLNRQYRANGMPETDAFQDANGRHSSVHSDGKSATDFNETDNREREHPAQNRDIRTMELPL